MTIMSERSESFGSNASWLEFLVSVEPDNASQELNLFGSEIALGSIYLSVYVPSINEQDLIKPLTRFASIEEPQCARQVYSVEEVTADYNYNVHYARLY